MDFFILTIEILLQMLEAMNQREFNYIFNRIKIINIIAPKNSSILIQCKPQSKKYCFRVYYIYAANPNVNVSEILKCAEQYQSRNLSSSQLSNIIQKIQMMNKFQIQLKGLVDLAYREIDHQLQNGDNRQLELFKYTLSEEDFITKKNIKFPRIYFNNEQMNTFPCLIDQQTFFNDIIDNFADMNIFQLKHELSKNDNSLIQILWLIKLGLQDFYKMQQINIEYYPQNRNCCFRNMDQPLFIDQNHYMKFIERNRRFSKIDLNYLGKSIQQVELQFFEVKQSDIVDDDIFYIDIYKDMPYYKEILEILQNQFSKFQYKKQIQIEKICVKNRGFKLIHSTECQIDNITDILDHYIEDYKCMKCHKQIIDISSLYVDSNLYDAYQKLSDILNQQFYIDNPIVYLSKICIQIQNKELRCYIPKFNFELLNYSLEKYKQFEEQLDNQNKTSEEVDGEIDHYLYQGIQNDYE